MRRGACRVAAGSPPRGHSEAGGRRCSRLMEAMAVCLSLEERRIRMRSGIGQTPQLTRCMQLNALPLAFSLAHTVADYGVIFATTDFNTWGVASYLGVSSAVYGWWGWARARAAPGRPAALARPSA